ncbi:MAG: hypothetical protein ACPIOQ_17160 [Promethearchaeia archaeon]
MQGATGAGTRGASGGGVGGAGKAASGGAVGLAALSDEDETSSHGCVDCRC